MGFNKKSVIFFGFVIHVCAAIFSVGYHHCDELFQIFEFAGYKLGINNVNDLPWEFNEQMRSGIQPLIVYLFTKGFYAISIYNPFTIALFIRLIQGLLSFLAIVLLLNYLEKFIISQKLKLWLWAFTLLFWCLPYFHVRFSSENFSATIFVFALAILLPKLNSNLNFWMYLLVGIFLGISFLSRFQISFFIIGLFAWLFFIQKIHSKNLLIIFIGLLMALGIGILADYWLYGEFTLSWWNYLNLNLFKDKASTFGKEPIYFYLTEALVQLIPPFSLLIIFSSFAFWKTNRLHVITWLTLPFILLHSFVSHKELRFLFPVLNFLPFMMVVYFQSRENSKVKFNLFLKKPNLLYFAIVVNFSLLVFFTFKPADNNSNALKAIFDNVKGENPILFYESNNPYNNAGALNYFRNKKINTIKLTPDSLINSNVKDRYYFSEKFNEGETILKNNKKFACIYSNFPTWFSYLNFNGWLDRSFTFSIYKQQND